MTSRGRGRGPPPASPSGCWWPTWRGRRRAGDLPHKRTLPHRAGLGRGLVRGRAGTRLRREQRREQLAELRDRALRAEREAERERLLAVAEERARIARDLHDSAGHAISVIAVRAGAARLRHQQDPDRSLVALEAIEELARQTAAEIDQLVGTLRDGGSANGVVEGPPSLASLETLVAHHQAAGLEVTLDTAGAPRPLATPPIRPPTGSSRRRSPTRPAMGRAVPESSLPSARRRSRSPSPTRCRPTGLPGPAEDTG